MAEQFGTARGVGPVSQAFGGGGVLGVEHRRDGPAAVAGARLADESNGIAMVDDLGDQPVELVGPASVEHRCGDADHVGSGERLALGQRPIVSEEPSSQV